MEQGIGTSIAITILIVGLVVVIGASLFNTYKNERLLDTSSTSAEAVYLTPVILPPEEGITSSTVQVYNQTWLDFDGVDDVVVVESSDIAGVTFWYKNSTSSDWIFIVNNSGVTFVNAVAGTPVQYPVYHNSTHYFLGMTDASTYFNGSIDDFRVYGYNLNTTQINSVYSEGRQ